MPDISFSLATVLDDLSNNIYNIINDYDVNDISNQIVTLNDNINQLNTNLEQVLNLYTIINELKQRLNT